MRRSLGFMALLAALAAAVSARAADSDSNVPGDPFAWILTTYEGTSAFDDPDHAGAEVAIREVDLWGTPLYVARSPWQVALGADLRWNGFDFSNVDFPDLDLYTVSVPLDVIYSNASWTFWAEVSPSIFSDFESVTADDYRTLGGALASYSWKPGLDLALGAAYDREFGEDRLYPMAGFVWDPGMCWKLSFVLPMPVITYAPTRKLLVFADARPAGGNWNIEDDTTGEDLDLNLEGYRIGAGLEYELAPHIRIHIAGGASIARRYEIGEGHNRLFEADADDTYFARAGIVVR